MYEYSGKRTPLKQPNQYSFVLYRYILLNQVDNGCVSTSQYHLPFICLSELKVKRRYLVIPLLFTMVSQYLKEFFKNSTNLKDFHLQSLGYC